MKIRRCYKLKEFIFNDKVVFPNLETLRISSTSAEKIWHNQLPTMSSSFQNLNRLVVQGCDNLKELFTSSMVNSFVQLQYLEISHCSLLEEVVFMEELKEEERKDTQFPLLKEMTIEYCPSFKGFISNDKIGFPSLKEMKIRRCYKLKEFIFNDKVVFPNLETLEISGIGAKKIWHNQLPTMSSPVQNLNRLDLYHCYNLKQIFPSSMVNSFVQLQYLKISDCSLLEEVVFMEELKEEERKDTQFLFLKEMKISDCPSFKGFISNDKIGFPSLKEMEIRYCPKLKEFNFNDKVEVPNLEKLTISWMDNLEKIWHNQLVKDSFCKLKSLKVRYCKKLLNVFPSNFCGRLLSSLESLEVTWCHSLEEIFDLRELSIHDSQKMLSFESLQRLKVLKVERCDSLINLMPLPTSFKNPSTSFQNLTSLTVGYCYSLINIGTSSVVKSLVQLTEMSISSCEKITEVIGYHGDVIEDEIIFRKLKCLWLQSLPSLISFCSWNFTLKFPSLETLSVKQCPNMKIFSQGALTTEKLQEVKIDLVSVELHPDFNLNTTIQQSHEKAISAKDNGASSSRHLK